MSTYIALLKGINVGGHKKVPMAALRELLSKTALKNVRTYIQSGNVIFQSAKENKVELEELIQQEIKSFFEFEVAVLIKKRTDLKRIFDACPFSEEKRKQVILHYYTIHQVKH